MNSGDLIASRYRLIRPIGRGAMGTVWAARHELLGREFALKFARIPTTTDPAARARFQREAQLVGKLRHPNIVDVTDFGEVCPDGDFFLAMELLEGESLAERIARAGHLDSSESVGIAADVARGLSAVHAVGIVHRDVKPENIFLARSPTGGVVAKLLDFGISKEWNDTLATQQGALTGTPAYMSPEQANGETKLDPRTDIWSLGVVLYEMLTGKHPFVEKNYQALMTAIAERPHVPLDASTPENVCRIVARCLSKRPADRYQNCDELAAMLQALDGQGSQVGHTKPRRRLVRGVVMGVAFVGLIVIGFSLWISSAHSTNSLAVSAAPSSSAMVPSSSVSTTTASPVACVPVPPSQIVGASSVASSVPHASTRPSAHTPEKRVTTSVTTPGF